MRQELTGTIKALLDEYKKAINELIAVIKPLSGKEILVIRDDKTTDENCRSVQTILTHVVYAGYGYTNFIETQPGSKKERRPKQFFENADEYIDGLKRDVRQLREIFYGTPKHTA